MRYRIASPLTDSAGQNILHMYESVPELDRVKFSEHHHTEIELCYVLSGSGNFKIRDVYYDIAPGALFVFPSNEVHWIESIGGKSELRLLDLKFEPRLVWSPQLNLFEDNCLRSLFGNKCVNYISPDNQLSTDIGAIMKQMHEECLSSKKGREIMVKADLYKLLVLLVRSEKFAETTVIMKNSENLKNIEKAMQYINSNLSRKFTLEELAEISCFSRTYFSALFKELNGVSPWEYINIKRIEKAKLLLAERKTTILYVASECGFENISNFNRIFKKITGKTPSDYRK